MDHRDSGRRARVRRRLAALIEGRQSFDIVRAALLVAAEHYAELDVNDECARVAAFGRRAAARARGCRNAFARHDALRSLLYDELGLHGNADDYDDPRNCYLNEVLARRTGIPLTLGIVLMEAARRCGFEASGVGLPGHFVVRLAYGGREFLVDPFHGGRVITLEDCRDLVGRATGRPSLFRQEQLAGITERAMLRRLLLNLKRVHLAADRHAEALSAVERLLQIWPDDPQEIRDRGFLLAHLGSPGAAVADLEAYLELEPGAPDAASVRGRLAWLRRRLTEIN